MLRVQSLSCSTCRCAACPAGVLPVLQACQQGRPTCCCQIHRLQSQQHLPA